VTVSKHILAAALVAVSVLAGCRGDPEKEANKLFVEASPLWAQYQALPERDPAQYEARLALLTQVDENLKAIVSDYPESSLAVELASTGSVKNLNKAEVDGDRMRLEQSIKASALMIETIPIWTEYQALPTIDPENYESHLRLLSQIDINLEKLLTEFPLSYEAESLTLNANAIKAEIIRLEESIPASDLLAKTLPLWEQYKSLSPNDSAKYEYRLQLLRQVNVNLEKLLRDFPHSYQVAAKFIDPVVVDSELHQLELIIDSAPLIEELMPLWQKYMNLPSDDPAQYVPRLAALNKIKAFLDELPEDYDYVKLGIDPADVRYEIQRLDCLVDVLKCAISEASKAVNEIKPAFPHTFSLIDFAEVQFLSGDVSGANETLSEALRLSKTIKLASAREKAVIGVSGVKALLGDLDGAKAILNNIPDSEARKRALSDLGKPTNIPQGDFMPDLIGELDKAMGVENTYDRAVALIAVARSAAKKME
jgi:outer membrane murein-binding lipoprotein Lpp